MNHVVSAYSTLRQPPALDFPCELLDHRDSTHQNFFHHLSGLVGFVVDRGKREMTSSLHAVVGHVERVQHHFSLSMEPSEIPSIAQWCWASNSILLFPDGSLRDPSGNVLVDPKTGLAAENAEIPYPTVAKARAARSDARLHELGIASLDELPPVVSEPEVACRAADEVAWRILSLFIVAVRAESLASGKPIAVDRLREKSPMAFQSLSPNEQAFLDHDSPDEHAITNAVWRYEAMYTLQWALGIHDELKFAEDICDVPLVAQIMVDRPNSEFVTEARLRDVSEILDALDLNQRMLWSARDAALQQRQAPAGIDGSVLSERQHALNWLVMHRNAPWDDVDTPT
jgi:hypothetical protein